MMPLIQKYNPIRWLILLIIRLYQLFISPLLGPRCRYYPTCSHYAQQAIQQHGVLCGSWLALKRIARCHPASEGGIDPVPECGCHKPAEAHNPQRMPKQSQKHHTTDN